MFTLITIDFRLVNWLNFWSVPIDHIWAGTKRFPGVYWREVLIGACHQALQTLTLFEAKYIQLSECTLCKTREYNFYWPKYNTMFFFFVFLLVEFLCFSFFSYKHAYLTAFARALLVWTCFKLSFTFTFAPLVHHCHGSMHSVENTCLC